MDEDIQQAGELLELFLDNEKRAELKMTCEDQEEGARKLFADIKQAMEKKESGIPCGYFDPEAGPECCEHVIEATAALEAERDALRGQLAALRELLDDNNYTIQYLARADTDCSCDPSVGMEPCLECEIRRAAREFAFMLASPANGKPEAELIKAAVAWAKECRHIWGEHSAIIALRKTVERMEEPAGLATERDTMMAENFRRAYGGSRLG